MATQLIPPNTETSPGGPEEEPKVMGFFEHLDELRMRIVRSVIAIGIGMIISLAFTNEVIKYLASSYGQELNILDPAGSVTVFLRVAVMLGAILAMPIITYHVFMFIIPGLTKQERRWVFMALPGTTFLFLFGIAFTWSVLVPVYINFLKNFQSDIFQVQWTADSYISFVTAVLFWHGVAFETPVIFYALGRMGLVTPRTMIRQWRQAIVVIAIISAVITPTVDPMTMGVIMGVLVSLYFVSILLVLAAVIINRRRLAKLSTSV